MTTKAIHTECPACGHHHDRMTGVGHGDPPKPGDVSLCIKCGAICQLDADLAMVLVVDWATNPHLAEARKVQREIRLELGLPV